LKSSATIHKLCSGETLQKLKVMPTMKQVDEMIQKLADEFDFSEREARVFLNLPTEVKAAKCPASQSPESKPRGRPPKTDKAADKAPDKATNKTTTPRAPSAYNLYVKAESAKVKADLEKSAPGGKLERGAVMKELGARWKMMSDSQKANYAK
jgi:hypothetical protein